jgi:hypothetical protein
MNKKQQAIEKKAPKSAVRATKKKTAQDKPATRAKKVGPQSQRSLASAEMPVLATLDPSQIEGKVPQKQPEEKKASTPAPTRTLVQNVTPLPVSETPSEERIRYGDIPTPERGYCPFPLDVWPGLNRHKFYCAMNKIALGIMIESPLLHLEGLIILYDISKDYRDYAEKKWSELKIDFIYNTICSGTGNLKNHVLWIRRELIDNKGNPEYYDSNEMMAIFADEHFSPNICNVVDKGNWHRVDDVLNDGAHSYKKPLIQYTRILLKGFLNSKDGDAEYSEALNRILKIYNTTETDLWGFCDFLKLHGTINEIGIDNSVLYTPAAVGQLKIVKYWTGNFEELDLLYNIWQSKIPSYIDGPLVNFKNKMININSDAPLITWNSVQRDLSLWIGYLASKNRITTKKWHLLSSVYRMHDSSELTTMSSQFNQYRNTEYGLEINSIINDLFRK